jgi:hypothetical protein
MFRFVAVLASVGFVEFAAVFGGWVSAAHGVEHEIKAAMARARIPFVENGGQISDQNVAYHAETFAGGVVVEKGGAVAFHVSNAESGGLVVRERYCDDALSPTGIHPSMAKVSYFRGNDPTAWQSGLPTFEAISLGEISDGISLVFEAHNNNVEKIFTVAPGAHPRSISAQIEGIEGLRVLPNGELELCSERGPFCFSSPIACQRIDGRRHDVKVAYTLRGNSSYGFGGHQVAVLDLQQPRRSCGPAVLRSALPHEFLKSGQSGTILGL